MKFSTNTREQILTRYHRYKYKEKKNTNTKIISWNILSIIHDRRKPYVPITLRNYFVCLVNTALQSSQIN